MRRFVLVAAACACPVAASADPLRLTTEEYPPFNYRDPATHELAGMSVDVVKEAMRRAGVENTIDLLPWQRAYAAALDNPGTCVFSTTITDDRKPLFKWVGPLAANDWALFAKAGSGITITSLADAARYRIGGYQGDAATEFMTGNGIKVDATARDDLNPAKVEAGRIDLWITGTLLGPYLAKAQGIADLKPVFTVKHTELALACNKAVPDQTVAALSTALDAIRADGTVERLQAKYR